MAAAIAARSTGPQLLLRALLAFLILGPESFAAGESARITLQGPLTRLGWKQVELRRTHENHLFLFARLNGRKESVLVDTGWSLTTVSTNAARRLKTLSEAGLTLRDPFFGTRENSPVVLLENLKLGGVEFINQPALVQNMVLNGRPAPFDLVLGCDFLIRNFCVVDSRNRRLYGRHGAPTAGEQEEFEEALRRGGFLAVQLERKEPLALTCFARVNGENLEMLVDSAAPWSCVDVRQAGRLKLKTTASPARITGVGRTGTRGVSVAAVKSFQLAEVNVKITNLAVFNLGDWGFAVPDAPLSEVQGILGGDALNAASAVIDCHALKLWVKSSRAKR